MIYKFSGGVVLEISKVRKPCYVLDAINPKLKEDIVGRCGMYAKVIEESIISRVLPVGAGFVCACSGNSAVESLFSSAAYELNGVKQIK